MEQILKNTALFVNILGTSRTSAVQQWDVQEFKRALKWADYFQQVHFKVETREKQRSILDKELKLQSCKCEAQLGTCVVQFGDLKHAKRLLCDNILQNLWCAPHIYSEIIKLCFTLPEVDANNNQFPVDLKEIVQVCHTSKVLARFGPELMQTRFAIVEKESITVNENKNVDHAFCQSYTNGIAMFNFGEEFSKRVQARVLRDYIMKCLACVESKSSLLAQIDAILSSRDDYLCLLSMVCKDADISNPEFFHFIVRLAKERLNPKWKDNHCNILGMPPAIVLDIAVISEEIFMDYIRLLFHCCDLHDEQNSMEEQFLISRLREAGNIGDIKLMNLEKHFQEINIRKDQCIHFLPKVKNELFSSCLLRSCQLCHETIRDQLAKKHLSFLY